MLHEKVLRSVVKPQRAAVKAATVDFSGEWINEMQSTMTLAVVGSDVTGTYTSSSSAGGGPITGILKGYVSGDLISFTVLWPGGSMTAWVGQVVDEPDQPRIRTLWHLVTDVPQGDESEDFWMSIFAGADQFTRAART